MKHGKLILCSGLPLDRPSSFSRQLSTLGAALERRGWDALVLDARSAEAEIERLSPHAVLLLGYPDQFPFIQDERHATIPTYLWAQFSKPPVCGSLGRAVPVPLTWMSAMFLVAAGYPIPHTIIPHGVDTRVFSPGRVGTIGVDDIDTERTFVVGTVGANSRRKRFDILLSAFARVRGVLPEAKLCIKTDKAEKQLGYDMPAMARAMGIADSVVYVTEDLNDSRMAAFYNRLDLYVHASEWEGFGIPVVEAMSCGVPVAAVPTQGPAEILPYYDLLVWDSALQQDGATVLRWANPVALADSILKARSDPGLRQRLALLGRESAAALYDIDIVAESWEHLICTRKGRR